MKTTLDTVIAAVRQQPPETQEVVGRFVQAGLAGKSVTLAQIEQQYRDEHTRAAIAEVEQGEYTSLAEARTELTAYGQTLRTT